MRALWTSVITLIFAGLVCASLLPMVDGDVISHQHETRFLLYP